MSIKGFSNVPNINGLLFWGCGALGAGCTVVGVCQGLVDVGLVLGMPCGGCALFCGGLWVWGSLGPSRSRKYAPMRCIGDPG